MEELGAIIKAVCIVSVGISVVEGLVGGTALKNQMKFVLSLAFITVLIVPFVRGGAGFSIGGVEDFFTSDGYIASSELYGECLEEQVSANIAEVIANEFRASGISCEKIKVIVNISETNRISINKVIINTKQVEDAERVIRTNLGEEVIIENEAG